MIQDSPILINTTTPSTSAAKEQWLKELSLQRAELLQKRQREKDERRGILNVLQFDGPGTTTNDQFGFGSGSGSGKESQCDSGVGVARECVESITGGQRRTFETIQRLSREPQPQISQLNIPNKPLNNAPKTANEPKLETNIESIEIPNNVIVLSSNQSTSITGKTRRSLSMIKKLSQESSTPSNFIPPPARIPKHVHSSTVNQNTTQTLLPPQKITTSTRRTYSQILQTIQASPKGPAPPPHPPTRKSPVSSRPIMMTTPTTNQQLIVPRKSVFVGLKYSLIPRLKKCKVDTPQSQSHTKLIVPNASESTKQSDNIPHSNDAKSQSPQSQGVKTKHSNSQPQTTPIPNISTTQTQSNQTTQRNKLHPQPDTLPNHEIPNVDNRKITPVKLIFEQQLDIALTKNQSERNLPNSNIIHGVQRKKHTINVEFPPEPTRIISATLLQNIQNVQNHQNNRSSRLDSQPETVYKTSETSNFDDDRKIIPVKVNFGQQLDIASNNNPVEINKPRPKGGQAVARRKQIVETGDKRESISGSETMEFSTEVVPNPPTIPQQKKIYKRRLNLKEKMNSDDTGIANNITETNELEKLKQETINQLNLFSQELLLIQKNMNLTP